MQPEDKLEISKQYGISDGKIFASWLRSLNYLRNICAHHSRLWNSNIVDQAKITSKKYQPTWSNVFSDEFNSHKTSRVAPLLFILSQLVAEISPKSTWKDRLTSHLLGLPVLNNLGIDYASMGFNQNLSDWIEWK